MLSANEKNCICEIVELIPISDLLSLAATVTNNCIEINTKEDAVKSLLLHESSLKSFLTRKKITRNVIFNYLHSKNVNFESTVDKNKLIDLTISYWQQKSQNLVCQEILLGPSEAALLGQKFAEWFYPRLNIDFNNSEGQELIEEDFWNDCQTSIYFPKTSVESHDMHASSAKDTLLLLKNVKSLNGLLFSPNLAPGGIETITEPHGLVKVKVCGTLHSREGNCVGLFEQMFGLIKNPLSVNNYKIKNIILLLRYCIPEEPRMIEN